MTDGVILGGDEEFDLRVEIPRGALFGGEERREQRWDKENDGELSGGFQPRRLVPSLSIGSVSDEVRELGFIATEGDIRPAPWLLRFESYRNATLSRRPVPDERYGFGCGLVPPSRIKIDCR